MNVYVIEFDSAARQQSISTWKFSHDAFWQILHLNGGHSFIMSIKKLNFFSHYFYTKKVSYVLSYLYS